MSFWSESQESKVECQKVKRSKSLKSIGERMVRGDLFDKLLHGNQSKPRRGDILIAQGVSPVLKRFITKSFGAIFALKEAKIVTKHLDRTNQ